jgi:hypothetical protein
LGFRVFSILGDKDASKISVKIHPINGSKMLSKCPAFFKEADKIKDGCNTQHKVQYNVRVMLKCLLIDPALQAYTRAVDKTLALTWKTMRNDVMAALARQHQAAGQAAPTPNKIFLAQNEVPNPHAIMTWLWQVSKWWSPTWLPPRL